MEFPDAETIQAIVTCILDWTSLQELTEENYLSGGFPLPARAENFHFALKCFVCDFRKEVARKHGMQIFQIGAVKIGLRKDDQDTFIWIGFLSHEKTLAIYFGHKLLEHIKAALTPEAFAMNALRFAVRGEHHRRQGEIMTRLAMEQFGLDSSEIMALADQEVRARKQALETRQRGFIDLSGEDFVPDSEDEDLLGLHFGDDDPDLSLTSKRRIH